MSISVLVNGAKGRMGHMTAAAIQAHPRLTLVGELGRQDNLKSALQSTKAQVVVDFTRADTVFTNALTIIEAGAHPVIGTSGLTQEEIAHLQQKCAALKLGGIIAPNFSVGAVLMMKYAQELVKYMPHVEIIEMHHDGKVDSPSGTALRTAEMIAEAKTINTPDKTSRETIPGARGATHHGIPIHAIRLPGLLAHQEIIFGQLGETLTLRHDSIDRQCFMPGVCLACEKVVTLDQLVYGLGEVL